MTRRCSAVALAALSLVAALATTGCAVSVAAELDETRANRIVALLDANGIAAEKTADPTEPGRYRVEVASGESAEAVALLADAAPSSAETPGVLEALGATSLVPSPQAEHERLLAGIAGDLIKSLEGLDGVLSARVHLAVARPDPLAVGATDPAPPTAAVLLRYRGARPITEAAVQKLVAYSVPGLSPERVAVVYSEAPPPRPARELVRLGPVSATRATAHKVRALVMGVLLVNLALATCLVVLWTRLRRMRADAASSPKPRATR